MRASPERILDTDRVLAGQAEGAWCSAWTASATRCPRITQEILIGDVAIISMLIPGLAEDLEDLGRDARVRLHAGTDDRDLADVVVRQPHRLIPELRQPGARASSAPSARPRAEP